MDRLLAPCRLEEGDPWPWERPGSTASPAMEANLRFSAAQQMRQGLTSWRYYISGGMGVMHSRSIRILGVLSVLVLLMVGGCGGSGSTGGS